MEIIARKEETLNTKLKKISSREERGIRNSQETLAASPTPEARGDGQVEQPRVQGAVAARAPEGLEELFHIQG